MELRTGQSAPDFSLQSHLEKKITLSSLQGSNVIIVFFPLAWTPV
jgi:peroxiredoxin